MRKLLNSLILLTIVAIAQAQTWPSGAMSDPALGLPPIDEGQLSISAATASLSNEQWEDNRMRFRLGIGLGHGLGLNASSSMRDLSGFGAFQNGIEDTRLGLSIWPLSFHHDKLRFGLNGNLILPTGFRTQEMYYDSASQTGGTLPSFTLDRTGGELLPALLWSPGKAAAMNAFAGLFSNSDQTEQAFRWGMNMRLSPFGEGISAELGYSQSITRTGVHPDTEILSAGLKIGLRYGLSLTPGFWAELEEDPMVGMGIGLSFNASLPNSVFPSTAPPPQPAYRSGLVLVPPPLTEMPLAGINELWKELRQEMKPSFDKVMPLETLDRPGLPYNEESLFWNSISAIAAAYPNAQWLLITHVEREEVNRVAGLSIPLMVEQPTYEAECRLRFQLVDLFAMKSFGEQIVEARAVRKDGLRLPIFASVEKDVLSMDDSRELTFEAYRRVGREIAMMLPATNP